MYYACQSGREGNVNARCPSQAEEGRTLCTLHNQKAVKGETVAMAPVPGLVLYKFDINGMWREKFTSVGVEVRPLDVRTREVKRSTDSGTKVFGPNGLGMASLTELISELADAFKVVDIYIQPRTGASDALVVSFSNIGNTTKNVKAMFTLMDLLSARCWKYVHVWANPPRAEDGLIVHTVNSIHWEERRKPAYDLHFANGLWEAVHW